MYEVSLALRQFKGLINDAAWRYVRTTFRTNSKMEFRDAQAEGFLTLVGCCRSYPEGQAPAMFERYFKRALYNKYRDLYRDGLRGKRKGVEVSLNEAFKLPAQEDTDSAFMENARERYVTIRPFISDDAQRLMQLILEPSQELLNFAWRDFCKKNKLRNQGYRVRGHSTFRIKMIHIRGVLHMTHSKMREVVGEVRNVSNTNL